MRRVRFIENGKNIARESKYREEELVIVIEFAHVLNMTLFSSGRNDPLMLPSALSFPAFGVQQSSKCHGVNFLSNSSPAQM